MRVLVVHNRYRSDLPSGENRVVDDEIAALRAAGIEVDTYLRSSDEIASMGLVDRVRVTLGPLTGAPSCTDLRRLLRHRRPDVVHLHNPYPLISPRVIDLATDEGIPVVVTIHNYRLRCINGLFFRDGAICTVCEERGHPLPGVVHGCYRGSRAQSAVMAAALLAHRRAWSRVTCFIAVSEFVADRLGSWGVSPERVRVKPNPVPDPGSVTTPGRGFLFAGRLAREKGIELLLDAWEASGLDGQERLLIAGDGPARSIVQERARRLRSVDVLGQLPPSRLSALRRATGVSVTPSLGFEAHPSIAESFAHGRAVLVTNVGALHHLVDTDVGWVTQPTAGDLAATLRDAADRASIRDRGRQARERYEACYRPDIVINRLIEIYDALSS